MGRVETRVYCDAAPEIDLPDCKTELIVHFGDDFFKYDSTSDQFVGQVRVLMSGQLTEGIAGVATTVDSRIKVLGDMLTEHLGVDSGEYVFVRQACNYLVQSEGQYSVAELAKLIGFSENQLERKFKHQLFSITDPRSKR